MKSSVAAAIVLLAFSPVLGQEGGNGFRVALPGYVYQFPRDHFSHPEFQTEWWYYTGNLSSADGREFGFELTFFRHAAAPRAAGASPWHVRDLYLAHFAVSDLQGRRFLHEERLNRAGPGIAGASLEQQRIWNGNWSVTWDGTRQRLAAIADSFGLALTLDPLKPPVIHGRNGVSQKAAGAGKASHYVSLTRLRTSGTLEVAGQRFAVTGTSWMDHEFFTHQLEEGQVGWDWFSIQLEDDSELMLFRLRREGGGLDAFSSGTYIDREGRSVHLSADEFRLEPVGQTWTSRDTGAIYPIRWRVRVTGRSTAARRVPDVSLELTTPLESQEIVSRAGVGPSYWEGAIRVVGQLDGRPARGRGYLEMTGYDRAVTFGGPSPTREVPSRR